MSSRIGKGPWARAFGAALVPDESVPVALRGAALADAVEELRIEPGLITARVAECTVTLSAPTVPPRIWAAMVSYARNRGALERAVAGELQSEHLEHLMAQDWDEPLIPPAGAIVRTCSCDVGGVCEHVAAVVYAVAAEVDADPPALLRWRGCVPDSQPPSRLAKIAAVDPWRGGELPEVPGGRRSPTSVLNRLGASGIRVGDVELVDVLTSAYLELETCPRLVGHAAGIE